MQTARRPALTTGATQAELTNTKNGTYLQLQIRQMEHLNE